MNHRSFRISSTGETWGRFPSLGEPFPLALSGVLGVYDFLMLFSILLLQWHYVVDLAGGAAVSFIAIMIYHYQCKGTPLASHSLLNREVEQPPRMSYGELDARSEYTAPCSDLL